jgi:N-acetylmuramoyl-L-alanine amidase
VASILLEKRLAFALDWIIQRAAFYVMNTMRVPLILLEMGFA